MARTKGDAARKAGGKAPRKTSVLNPSSKTISKRTGRSKHLNPAVRRPVPKWQNPITEFFCKDGSSFVTDKKGKIIEISEDITDKVYGPSESTKSATLSIDQPGCSFANVEMGHLEPINMSDDDEEESVLELVKNTKLDDKNSAGESDYHTGDSSSTEGEWLLEEVKNV